MNGLMPLEHPSGDDRRPVGGKGQRRAESGTIRPLCRVPFATDHQPPADESSVRARNDVRVTTLQHTWQIGSRGIRARKTIRPNLRLVKIPGNPRIR